MEGLCDTACPCRNVGMDRLVCGAISCDGRRTKKPRRLPGLLLPLHLLLPWLLRLQLLRRWLLLRLHPILAWLLLLLHPLLLWGLLLLLLLPGLPVHLHLLLARFYSRASRPLPWLLLLPWDPLILWHMRRLLQLLRRRMWLPWLLLRLHPLLPWDPVVLCLLLRLLHPMLPWRLLRWQLLSRHPMLPWLRPRLLLLHLPLCANMTETS